MASSRKKSGMPSKTRLMKYGMRNAPFMRETKNYFDEKVLHGLNLNSSTFM